ncbi:MAG: indole-3-glycerol phosphate synthase TrpC [Ignavibacteriae bacterium HGW-Ignavibacteriae-3]|nr:MAG: indole-3-glycerol phosphate synthase TrpC [Ignavibacteriae bacterium HGW-Ignavibacteriae-3]
MSILDDILKVKKDEVNKLKSEYSLSSFRDFEFFDFPVRSLKDSLTHSDRLGIITEIKRASPSKGLLKEDFDHIGIANIYMENQTDAISILTDKNFFQGDINYLREIAEFKTTPLLRKDFIIDEYQIFEAKANGADAILLIAETLSKNQIAELTGAAAECGLEVLLEIHSGIQIDKIDFTKNSFIGVNNRDLSSFNVNLGVSRELSEIIPDGVFLISESGIKSRDDIIEIKKTKIKAVLVGEHFMRSDNIGEELKIFKEWCLYES